MGFLDNSADVLLDTVLTDTGRFRLAKGDGSFKISKFALADDEIRYDLYNNQHASGTAYYDLQIMQTPILEAFSNNMSSMKSLLISIPRNNLLYLPTIKINEVAAGGGTQMHTKGAFYVAVDQDTETAFEAANVQRGVMRGETLGGTYVRLDQGLDTSEISYAFTLDSDLVETQYILEMDNRFGKIVSATAKAAVVAKVNYIDDDMIASYYLSLGTDPDFVQENTNRANANGECIQGPRGTILQFRIQSSLELNSSNYLFDQLGTTGINGADVDFVIGATKTLSFIDTYIKITGASTGYSCFVPVRLVKVTS